MELGFYKVQYGNGEWGMGNGLSNAARTSNEADSTDTCIRINIAFKLPLHLMCCQLLPGVRESIWRVSNTEAPR